MASSWSVPVLGPGGLLGVITVFRATAGQPRRDDLDLATLYAGYAASAIERDRLLDEVTARNRVLETIREMLQTLAGPVPVADGLGIALQALRRGLAADEVALLVGQPDGPPSCRASAGLPGDAGTGPGRIRARPPGQPRPPARAATAAPASGRRASRDHRPSRAAGAAVAAGPAVTLAVRQAAEAALAGAQAGQLDAVEHRSLADGARLLSVAFSAPAGQPRWSPAGRAAARRPIRPRCWKTPPIRCGWPWSGRPPGSPTRRRPALRRSRELQRGFLSRLSHELRTPLTAIKGYASSLLQPDVTWDAESEQRFLTRIAAESSRLGRLVDDLLRFSAIESGILQLQRDWCDLPLVLDAAVACLPPADALRVDVRCADDLPVIWADHDRLEQVFVNLLSNAIGHNPPGTRVTVSAIADGPDTVHGERRRRRDRDAAGRRAGAVRADAAAARARVPVPASGCPSPGASSPRTAASWNCCSPRGAPASASSCRWRTRTARPPSTRGRAADLAGVAGDGGAVACPGSPCRCLSRPRTRGRSWSRTIRTSST